jgi:hypothetical protein
LSFLREIIEVSVIPVAIWIGFTFLTGWIGSAFGIVYAGLFAGGVAVTAIGTATVLAVRSRRKGKGDDSRSP